jgi:uncharacterized damage-inducible protein DinB
MDSDQPFRRHLAKVLDWEDAHATFDASVRGIEPRFRGVAPDGMPHSPWQLLEHLRVTQRDILDFCRSPKYEEKKWPEDYWPTSPAPATDAAWDESIREYRKDRDALKEIALDPEIDLLARVPNGSGQTYLRELLLVADHSSYHVGQLVLVRRALGIWE